MSKKSWFQTNFEVKNEPKAALKGSKSRASSNTSLKSSSSKQDIPDSDHDSDIEIVELNEEERQRKFLSIDWLKTFQPKDITDLAIHPKKLDDIRSWFKISCSKSSNRILLIEGPTGCGKQTAFTLVAKENSYDIIEWINATDVDVTLFYENSEKFYGDVVTFENQVLKFKDFLHRTSRYNSILSNKKRLLLVKDLPNTFLKKSDEFWKLLENYAEDGISPLVFVLTETNSKSLNISFNLFPDKIRKDLSIDTINFNPIASTMMKRGIKRIIELIESNSNFKPFFKKPSDEIMMSLIQQSQGDIRNAILNLSFASQKSDTTITVSKSAKPKVKSKVKTKPNSQQPKDGGSIGKNEVLSVLHGLGRVFHPKLEENKDSRRKELTHNPETIADSFSSQSENIMQMIYSNYIKNFGDIDSLSEAAQIFSLSDCISSEYRDAQLGLLNLNLVIRATMVLNIQPAGGSRSVSAHINKKWKQAEETNKKLFRQSSLDLNNGNMIAPKAFFCDYKNFMSKINVEE